MMMMMKKNKLMLPALLLTLLTSFVGSASAQTTQFTPFVGGAGPYPFTDYCPWVDAWRPTWMNGLVVRAGDYVDAVRASCSYESTVLYTPWRGGSGGGQVNLTCPAGKLMKGVNADYSNFVDGLAVACLGTDGRGWSYTPRAGTKGDYYDSLRCTSGTFGKGLRGETGPGTAVGVSGNLLARLSIYCSP